MSKTRLQPAADFVLVADAPMEQVIGGIELPDNIREREMLFGLVVEVGPDASKTCVHDKVMYGPYAGKHIIVNGNQLRILRQGQIEAYLREDNE
jgi:co-chaperonin GroES (HSP10)